MTALGACSSSPSNKRVVEDIIESLDGVSESAKDCMMEKVDRYGSDELDAIAKANEDFQLLPNGEIANPTEALADFQSDLASCLDDDTAGSEPAGSGTTGTAPAGTDVDGTATTGSSTPDTSPDTTLA